MLFFVGLGNPGPRYAATRHNVGFLFVDELLSRATNVKRYKRKRYYAARTELCGSSLLVKPFLFMNLSGIAVKDVITDFGFSGEDRLVVAYDDVWIPLGRIRIRRDGGDGGHKGIRSIIRELDRTDFIRVRIGIGPADTSKELTDYVLEEFAADQRHTVEKAVRIAADAALELCDSEISKVMSIYNSLGVDDEGKQV